jgi:quercetin 2,3-dioxygenase
MKVLKADRDDIQDLVTRRALPTARVDHIDPFLFLNHHGPQNYQPNNHGLPFGPHPHRGFETVTFILEGDIAHEDSGGHESVIASGGVQWMTAGSGLVHSETSSAAFKKTGGPLEILQLWLNLPKRLKMTTPKYLGLQRDAIPRIQEPGCEIELVSGKYKDQKGAFDPLVDVTLMILRLEKGAKINLPIPAKHNVFFYDIRGNVSVAEPGKTTQTADAHSFELVKFENEVSEITVVAKTNSVVLFGHAAPFGEPIVAHGPFVMNTREEIAEAIDDFRSGRIR